MKSMQCVQLHQQQLGTPIIIIFHVLRILRDLTWELHTANHFMPPESDLLQVPTAYISNNREREQKDLFTILTVVIFVLAIDSDKKIVELEKQRKGRFLTTTGETFAFLEEDICFRIEGEEQC